MLTILQLSDIHFSHKEESLFDMYRELQDGLLKFLPELRARVGDIGLILITGDIAFRGVAEQYAKADSFLRDVRSVLGDPLIPVRVIPGNHDIHQPDTDSGDQQRWRGGVRGTMAPHVRDDALNTMLQDKVSGPGLLEPLAAFNEFAAAYDCMTTPLEPFWEHTMPLTDGWTLKIRGLNSVLISNRLDATGRLVLGTVQTTGWAHAPGEVRLSVCHHPYCWLIDGDEQQPRLQTRGHIHITGHVHAHDVRLHPDDSAPEHMHLLTGALQPPAKEQGTPRFNTLTVSVDDDADQHRLTVDLTAVRWEKKPKAAYVIDTANCHTVTMPLGLGPAATPEPDALTPPALAVERLTERFALLPFSDQVHALTAIEMPVSDALQGPAHEIVGRVLSYATAEKHLHDLWDEVQRHHGDQPGEDNPFEGGS